MPDDPKPIEPITPPIDPKPEPKNEPKQYDEDYVKRLREENKSAREKADALAKERDELAKFKSEKEAAELAAEKKWQELAEKTKAEAAESSKAAEERVQKALNAVKLAEAKALAIKEGIKDVDDVKLLDLSKVTVEDGEVIGLDEVIAAAKEKKPHWFGVESKKEKPGSPPSSNGGNTPAKDVREMTADDFEKVKQKMGHVRRF